MEAAEGATVIGAFPDRRAAEAAIRDLVAAGFDSDRVGLVGPTEAGADRPRRVGAGDTPVAEAITEGAVLGGIAGGVLGAALAGAGVGVATDGLLGALLELGVAEPEARRYAEAVQQGRTLVTVRADGRAAEASAILHRHGG
ncbi:MAG: hypothetical protein IRZ14_19190 [Chloroflexi bacterium]|nr:hypothetical protein [Chloroflexota bacterium]